MFNFFFIHRILLDKHIRLDIRCDTGSYVGLLSPQSWELLTPLRVDTVEFATARRRLVGLSETSKVFPFSAWSPATTVAADVENLIISQMRRFLNLHLVQGAGVNELLFAGSCRKGFVEERLYLSIECDGEKESTAVKVNCSDPVLCSSVMSSLSKFLTRDVSKTV